jgi:hypothetical protein
VAMARYLDILSVVRDIVEPEKVVLNKNTNTRSKPLNSGHNYYI